MMVLTTIEIKIKLLKKGVKASELAERWKVPKENLSRVINRTPGFLFPEIRQMLADFLGVPVKVVGREVTRNDKQEAA